MSVWLFTGCADLTVYAPAPAVETPEVTGKRLRWGLETGLTQGRNLTLVQNAGARPPSFAGATATIGGAMPAGGIVGVAPRVQVGLGVAQILPMEFGGYFKVQWQALGDSVEDAKRANIPLSVFARVTSTGDSKSGDQSSTFGAGGYPWRANTTLISSEIGLSVGYRLLDDLLIFGGLARSSYDGKTEITQDATPTNSGGSYSDIYHGLATSTAVGVTFGRDARVSISGAYNDMRIGSLPNRYWSAVYVLGQWYLGDGR